MGATAGWLRYHAEKGVDGALIFVRGRPEEAQTFAEGVQSEGPAGLSVLVVSANIPLGSAEDEGGAWDGPLKEEVVYEVLRHRFLSEARSVTALSPGEYLLPSDPGLIDRVAEATGASVMLRGRETFAWSGTDAAQDHIYVRRGETRWAVSWAVSPEGLGGDVIWRERGVFGVKTRMPPVPFVRAVGQVRPGETLKRDVNRAELIEDREVARHFAAAFDRAPVRRPASSFNVKRRPVVLVTTMKNEGPYIVDWVAHHRVVGIDDFLIYSNDCADGTDGLLGALAEAGTVTHRDNPYRKIGGAPQRAAFRAARKEAVVRDAAWLLPLDVDEYLNIHVGRGTLEDLFKAVPEATVFSMPWRLFGSADLEAIADSPVTEQFRLAAPDYAPRPLQAWGFKSLFLNDSTFGKIGVHAPRQLDQARAGEVIWVDGMGRPLPEGQWAQAWRMTPATWGYDLCQINHYAVRSAEAFLIKRERGRTNHTRQDQGVDYWFRMNFNGSEERSIDRYAEAVAVERARLMALPGVAAAHTRAVDWHRARAAALRATPDFAELWDAITGPRLRALSRRLGHFGNNVFILGQHVVPDEMAERPVEGDWSFTVPLPDKR